MTLSKVADLSLMVRSNVIENFDAIWCNVMFCSYNGFKENESNKKVSYYIHCLYQTVVHRVVDIMSNSLTTPYDPRYQQFHLDP